MTSSRHDGDVWDLASSVGATPTADRRTAAIDLRDDWPTALRAAGFDPLRPTAWSAEGLLGYLPPEAQDHLLDTITTLSAAGSRIATESRPNPRPGDDGETKEGLERIAGRWRSEGFDTDMSALRYYGDRNEAGPYLRGRGWSVSGSTVRELFSDKGFHSVQDDGMHLGDTAYVSGVLSASCSPRA